MSVHPALPVLAVSLGTPRTAALDADAAPHTPEPARAGASGRAERRPACLSLESPAPGLWLLRVAGRLDTATAARVLRLTDAQLDTVDTAREDAVLVIDLGEVASFERGGPESLRHAPYSAARRGVAVYLSGCGGRTHLLPLRARRVLAEFACFPTAEHAVHALAGADRRARRHPPRDLADRLPAAAPGWACTGPTLSARHLPARDGHGVAWLNPSRSDSEPVATVGSSPR